MPQPSAYSKGINFQCNEALVHNFVEASDWLERETLLLPPRQSQRLVTQKQRRIHVSLAYLCCLTKEEIQWAHQIALEWVMRRQPFHWSLRFDHVECVQVRPDAAGVLLVGDRETQQQLLRLNHELRDALEAAGVPVVVSREEQMRFHASLMGFVTENATSGIESSPYVVSMDDSWLRDIQTMTDSISEKYGNGWAGTVRMEVKHWPRVNSERSMGT